MLKKIKEIIRNRRIIFITGLVLGIIVSASGVYAANTIYSKNVTYDNSNSGLSATNVQDALDETYNRCFPPPKPGDYVSLKPTDKSGQELNLWRIISINEDNTIDIISEYVSSTELTISGYIDYETNISTYDYENYVFILNDFVTRYENEKYTIDSRAFGYNGQTESILEFDYKNNNGNFSESEGGGDTLYEKDYNLVMDALGTLKATKPDGSSNSYFVASRSFDSCFGIRSVSYNNWKITVTDLACDWNPWEGTYPVNYSVRPILTLKANLKYIGKGTKDSPYIFIDD